jgi:hypothetical protein
MHSCLPQGTGSVWRAPDYNTTGRYLINWSQARPLLIIATCERTKQHRSISAAQDPGNYQNITFGESYDLIHWTPLNKWFDIDERYYHNPGRWDCIYTIPVPEARRPAQGSMDGYPRCARVPPPRAPSAAGAREELPG